MFCLLAVRPSLNVRGAYDKIVAKAWEDNSNGEL